LGTPGVALLNDLEAIPVAPKKPNTSDSNSDVTATTSPLASGGYNPASNVEDDFDAAAVNAAQNVLEVSHKDEAHGGMSAATALADPTRIDSASAAQAKKDAGGVLSAEEQASIDTMTRSEYAVVAARQVAELGKNAPASAFEALNNLKPGDVAALREAHPEFNWNALSDIGANGTQSKAFASITPVDTSASPTSTVSFTEYNPATQTTDTTVVNASSAAQVETAVAAGATTLQQAEVLNSGGDTSKFTKADWERLKKVEAANNAAAAGNQNLVAQINAQLSGAPQPQSQQPAQPASGGSAPTPEATLPVVPPSLPQNNTPTPPRNIPNPFGGGYF
jgi:hypothetical protein